MKKISKYSVGIRTYTTSIKPRRHFSKEIDHFVIIYMNIVKCLKNELFGKIKLSLIPTLSGLCELSRYYVGTEQFNASLKIQKKSRFRFEDGIFVYRVK